MKKLLTTLAVAMLFASQTHATILNINNSVKDSKGKGEKLFFFVSGHDISGDFTNKRIVLPGTKKSIILIKNKSLNGPFFFARNRDLIPTRDSSGEEFIVVHKMPKNAYMTKMLPGWIYYNWIVENWSEVSPEIGMRIRRKKRFKNPWVKLEKIKFSVDGTEIGTLSKEDEKIRKNIGF